MIHLLPRCIRRAVLALLIAIANAAPAADRLEQFAQQIPLSVTGDGPWYRLQLPMEVLLASRHDDLRDLRVFNADGEALAYSLMTAKPRQDRSQTKHKLRAFPLSARNERDEPRVDVRVRRDAHGTLVEVTTPQSDASSPAMEVRRGWLLDASAIDRPLQKLVLDWTGVEGFQRFTIEASDDLQQWRSWGDGRVVRLSFAGKQIEQREVRLPGSKTRYLRLLWQSPALAPELFSAQVESASTSRHPAPLIWSQPLPARQTGEDEYVWELPMALPVERLRIPVERDNLLLPLNLETRSERSHKWRHLMSGLLYRVSEQDRQLLQEELDLPGWQPIKQLRLQVDPRGGGFGEQSPRLLFAIRATELIFLARGNQPYRLALGKQGAQSAALPLTTLMPGFQEWDFDRLPQALLAVTPEQSITELTPAVTTGQATDWKRIGLWAVLLGGVAILILMAWSLLRSQKSG